MLVSDGLMLAAVVQSAELRTYATSQSELLDAPAWLMMQEKTTLDGNIMIVFIIMFIYNVAYILVNIGKIKMDKK